MTTVSRRSVPPRKPRGNENNHVPERRTKVSFKPIPAGAGHRIVIYGPGGVGKTTLAATAPGPVVFFDLDDSLPRLRAQFIAHDVNVQLVPQCATWQNMRDALHSTWNETKTIVIDSATRAEELAVAHTLATVPHERHDIVIRRIEDYGYGKGYQHTYDTFLTLLGDLDQHTRAGRHVILVCHDCTNTVPNPSGEDWLRYEPRLQCPNSGKAAIRLRVREWADHVLFLGYDIAVRGGKGIGSGTRTVYPSELAHCMAKSRTIADPISLTKFDQSLWNQLLQ